MRNDLTLVRRVVLPSWSAVAAAFDSVDLADAFSIQLPPGASTNPELLARFIFSVQPSWIGALTAVRDTMVSGLGLKTARHMATLANGPATQRISIFKVFAASDSEVVLGENDKHLDFRVSVLCTPQAPPSAGAQLTLSTVVQCHNRLGRAYLSLIAPFHRQVVKASLRRAAKVGWPQARSSKSEG